MLVSIGILTLTLFVLMNSGIIHLSATSDPNQNAFSQKREGFLLYNNTEYGFQILYPRDWTLIEGDAKPGDYLTNIVTFEPLGEKGKHFTKKFICGEVCLAVSVESSQIGSTTLQQSSDDLYNVIKADKGFKLLEYNPETEFKLGGKKAFGIVYEAKQEKREYIHKLIGTLYPDPEPMSQKLFLGFNLK